MERLTKRDFKGRVVLKDSNGWDAVEKLAAYEDAEEEGRLLVLPCKLDDPLYITEPRIYNYVMHDGVQKGVCKAYKMDERYGWVVYVDLEEGEPHTLYFYKFSDFGKTVFLTREEAEAALEKMKGE